MGLMARLPLGCRRAPSYIDQFPPRLAQWTTANDLAREALTKTAPERTVTAQDIAAVLDCLKVQSLARGRAHYAVELTNN